MRFNCQRRQRVHCCAKYQCRYHEIKHRGRTGLRKARHGSESLVPQRAVQGGIFKFSGNGLKRQCRLLEKPEKPLCNQGKGDQRHRERACRQGMAKKGRGGGWGTVTWSLVSIKKRTENRVEGIEKINAAYFDIIACVARRRRSNPMAPPELEPRVASAEVVDIVAGCPEEQK